MSGGVFTTDGNEVKRMSRCEFVNQRYSGKIGSRRVPELVSKLAKYFS
jgi:hypothetical protein